MLRKRELLVGMLVAAGVYSEANARIYADSAPAARVDIMIRTLAGSASESAGSVMLGGQPK